MRTAEQNADEYRVLTKQGKDLRLAALVACSVEKGAGNGRPSKNPEDHQSFGKLSASAFAQRAGTSAARILLYLNVWNELCDEQGILLLPHSDSLTPDDVDSIEVSDRAIKAWDEKRLYPEGRAVRGNPAAVAKALATPEFLEKVLGNLDDDNTLQALARAIDDRTPRQPRDPKPRDYDRLVERATHDIEMALHAARKGEWEPSPLVNALLYFMTRILGERLAPEGEMAELVQSKLDANMDEIERYANTGGAR